MSSSDVTFPSFAADIENGVKKVPFFAQNQGWQFQAVDSKSAYHGCLFRFRCSGISDTRISSDAACGESMRCDTYAQGCMRTTVGPTHREAKTLRIGTIRGGDRLNTAIVIPWVLSLGFVVFH
jgi:hypothetical protein